MKQSLNGQVKHANIIRQWIRMKLQKQGDPRTAPNQNSRRIREGMRNTARAPLTWKVWWALASSLFSRSGGRIFRVSRCARNSVTFSFSLPRAWLDNRDEPRAESRCGPAWPTWQCADHTPGCLYMRANAPLTRGISDQSPGFVSSDSPCLSRSLSKPKRLHARLKWTRGLISILWVWWVIGIFGLGGEDVVCMNRKNGKWRRKGNKGPWELFLVRPRMVHFHEELCDFES